MTNRLNLMVLLLPVLLYGSCSSGIEEKKPSEQVQDRFTYFSKNVQDTFYLSVQLPVEYADSTDRRYPVVFLLDANFFFPMVAPVLHQYEKAGLLPPLILVGIGYQSWMAMDSLRQRDYLFPAALPSDEITAEGGGQKFAQFLSQELIPRIDKHTGRNLMKER